MENQPKKILIVDDEEKLQQKLVDACSREGFVALGASNGEEGLSLALREHPDLILLDLEMPKMGGIEMLKQLRKDEWGKNTPVIVLTNYDDSERVADVLEAGTYDYIIKSSRLEDIIKLVKQKLGLN